jgi:uncharacterized protein YndB with AHSA1/START domain
MRAVRSGIAVPATPQRALRAFLDPADLGAWWSVERTLVEPTEGGLYALAWGVSPHGFQYVTTGVISRYEPDRQLSIDHYTYFNPTRPILGPMRLNVAVAPGALGESRVEVTQDGYGEGPDWDWYYESVLAAWPEALVALQRHLVQAAS